MKILVIGGTGTVGSQVTANLIAANADVRVMTSTPEKATKLPAGVEGVVGNLRERASLNPVFMGVERVFLITPLSETETEEGLNAVSAAKASGVKRLVYMSVHHLEAIPDAPHFAGKIPIENAIRQSGIAFTFIRPNNFYQNDFWFQQPLVEYGVYAQPIGNKGVSRVDVRDIAEAVSKALLNDGHAGKTINLVGPDVLTGDGTARAYSQALGREIVYGGDDLEQWGIQAVKMLPQWMVDDFKIMFRHFQTVGFQATPAHLEETVGILGRKPRTFAAFVQEVTDEWKKAVKGGVKVSS